jgi:hypothetical protein
MLTAKIVQADEIALELISLAGCGKMNDAT